MRIIWVKTNSHEPQNPMPYCSKENLLSRQEIRRRGLLSRHRHACVVTSRLRLLLLNELVGTDTFAMWLPDSTLPPEESIRIDFRERERRRRPIIFRAWNGSLRRALPTIQFYIQVCVCRSISVYLELIRRLKGQRVGHSPNEDLRCW